MKKIKVLMIDDNVKLIDAVKESFKDNDNIEFVLEAHDGKEGFEVIKNKQDEYDLIILDLIMPEKDGLYVLEAMKSAGINKKVIVATSYNANDFFKKIIISKTSQKPWVDDYGIVHIGLIDFLLDEKAIEI